MDNNGLELYSENTYETAVDLDHFIMRRQEFPLTSDDSINGISYEVGYPTAEYSLYLLTVSYTHLDVYKRQVVQYSPYFHSGLAYGTCIPNHNSTGYSLFCCYDARLWPPNGELYALCE